MSRFLQITTVFAEGVSAINQKRNITLRAKLNPLFRSCDFENDSKIAAQAGEIISVEMIERSDDICQTLLEDTGEEVGKLSDEQRLTLRDLQKGWMLTSLNQIRNELFRHYESFPKGGPTNDGYILSYLAECVRGAEAAAFANANHRLRRLFDGVLTQETTAAAQSSAPVPAPDLTVFVDTNLFLQYRDLKDLPWKQVLPEATWIEIAVAKVVVDELEDHKNSQVRRRRDRSRTALKQIAQAPAAPNGALLLREANPKITVRFVRTFMGDPQKLAGLDLTHNDDRLVAAFIDGLAKGPCKLVSDDSGPRLTAYDLGHGNNVIEPSEDWRLSEEPDADNQKLKDLQNENARLKSQSPEVVIEHPKRLEWLVPDLPPLAPDLAKRLADEVLAENPRHYLGAADRSPLGALMSFTHGLSQTSIDEYEQRYDAYLTSVRDFFANLHEKAKHLAAVKIIPYRLRNISRITAQGLFVELSISNGAGLIGTAEISDKRRADASIPRPPERPKSLHEQFAHAPEGRPPLNFNRTRDPTGFYWQNRPSYGAPSASLLCAEFRPEEIYRGVARATMKPLTPGIYDLTIKVSATNLPSPQLAQIRVNLITEYVEWTDPRLEDLLPRDLYALLFPHTSHSGSEALG